MLELANDQSNQRDDGDDEMMRLTVIMCEENQSFSWPLSKTYWGSLHQRR
jgi:hypothetical protein